MDRRDCQRVVEFARTIFGGTRLHSPETFQEWALEQARALVPFDFATWGSGVVQNSQATIHAIYLYNVPHHDMQQYLQYQSQDPLLAKLVASRDRIATYDRYDVIPREQYVQTPFYKEYCRKYSFEQTIATMVPEPISNLFTAISFCRSDYDRPFSERDKEIKKQITPVLSEARRQNIFIHMIRSGRGSAHKVAISDGMGILHEAEPAFASLMVKEWPDWQGPQLNFIPQQILGGKRSARLEGEQIDILISVVHNLVLLQARRRGPLDILSAAERRVAMFLMRGLSDKEIANRLDISPKTVGHHLQRIYTKAGVANRQQAIIHFASDLAAEHEWGV